MLARTVNEFPAGLFVNKIALVASGHISDAVYIKSFSGCTRLSMPFDISLSVWLLALHGALLTFTIANAVIVALPHPPCLPNTLHDEYIVCCHHE